MKENSDNSKILTITEVAEYLKISEVTTYKLVQNGSLPSFKIGRSWRVKLDDLLEFIERKKGERYI
ncbi:helix-turn-helix domain-containing protein [Lacrimispora sp. 38-1]|uniref:helix-turn-helix domain-containing protein n=1 Tax=Lacrimispora sp. 38-1 TaxID=3125778 RepID=UPI003CF98056